MNMKPAMLTIFFSRGVTALIAGTVIYMVWALLAG